MVSVDPTFEFFKNEDCLIAEPSIAFSTNILACLQALGVPSGRTQIARKFEDACRAIREKKPKLLVTEYRIHGHYGLSLIELLNQVREDGDCISILVTQDSSDSVMAEAAEGEIDSFLVKPFSTETFRQKLVDVITSRINPTPYLAQISLGKMHLKRGDLLAATEAFLFAKTLDPKPSLASHYAGKCFESCGKRERALEEYREGRRHQPLHYRCLTSEFEALAADARFKEAHPLIEPMRIHFPVTSRRMEQFFETIKAVGAFDDLRALHQTYLRLDERPASLLQAAAEVMMAAGMHYLRAGDPDEAFVVFERGVSISGRDMGYLERVVTSLVQAGAAQKASAFLAKAPPSERGSPAYDRLVFKVERFTQPRPVAIERGRKLVQSGHADQDTYTSLVQLIALEGKQTLAESVIAHAVARFPDLRQSLYEILDTTVPEREKAG